MHRMLIILFAGILLRVLTAGGQIPEPWPVGERLFFDLSYGWIKGGEGSMLLTEDRQDSTLLHVKAEAHTTGIFAFFSPVHDRYESFFHRTDGYPVRTERVTEQGKKVSRETLLFLDDNRRVRSSRSGDHLYRQWLYDILSAFYQARRLLPVALSGQGGEQILRLPLFFDGKFFDVRLKYAGRETIRTLYGKQHCYRFVPDTTDNRTFTDERQLQIWVTADEQLLPVKVTARLPAGSLKCVLKRVQSY